MPYDQWSVMCVGVWVRMCACVCVCVRACVRACVCMKYCTPLSQQMEHRLETCLLIKGNLLFSKPILSWANNEVLFKGRYYERLSYVQMLPL